ncbi:MAG: hypothetical protein D4R79_19535 [Comamonadaceae bacterium]|nr:MAG: hypothetical protein D4R79_19535 [Comamonadaceae bacterium]
MKKLLTALISAAIIAMPLALISSPASAQGTSQAEPAKAKKASKAKAKAKKSKAKKAKKSAGAASQ